MASKPPGGLFRQLRSIIQELRVFGNDVSDTDRACRAGFGWVAAHLWLLTPARAPLQEVVALRRQLEEQKEQLESVSSGAA